jgi:hypothetical protein
MIVNIIIHYKKLMYLIIDSFSIKNVSIFKTGILSGMTYIVFGFSYQVTRFEKVKNF